MWIINWAWYNLEYKGWLNLNKEQILPGELSLFWGIQFISFIFVKQSTNPTDELTQQQLSFLLVFKWEIKNNESQLFCCEWLSKPNCLLSNRSNRQSLSLLNWFLIGVDTYYAILRMWILLSRKLKNLLVLIFNHFFHSLSIHSFKNEIAFDLKI